MVLMPKYSVLRLVSMLAVLIKILHMFLASLLKKFSTFFVPSLEKGTP